MRILFLSPRQCWPAITGAKLREFHLARALGLNGELTHVCFLDPGAAASEAVMASHLPFCRRVIGVKKPQPYTSGKIIRGFFDRLPLTLINYYSPEMSAAVTGLTRGSSFDLVHFDSIHMVTYLPVLPEPLRKRVVFNWHNIESELLRRYAATASSLPRKMYASLTARRLHVVEREILRNSFGHLVCSARERQVLLDWVPEARVAVVENGVDTAAFNCIAGKSRNRVLFVGTMAYHANSDAISWFADRIWPPIHERFPHWILTIVGSDPPPHIRALADRPAVEVTGTVPDVRPYYSEALLSVVPLLTGGGTRLKILESMAAGVPVVSTMLGIEGLTAVPGEEVLIADTQSEWLAACSSLADGGELWHKLTTAGRRLVESRYDWEVLGKTLVAIYGQWLAEIR